MDISIKLTSTEAQVIYLIRFGKMEFGAELKKTLRKEIAVEESGRHGKTMKIGVEIEEISTNNK